MQIIAVDPLFVVVNKPSGLLAVPGRGESGQDCVVSRIRELFPDTIAQPAVHRLDMDTSGLMALARTREAHRHLSVQFAQRAVEKKYIALLEGRLDQDEGEISLAFRLDPENRPLQIYDPLRGKMGISRWRLLGHEGGLSRIEFIPLTGRTHQLRLHAAHPLGLGLPIVGDRLYGLGQKAGQLRLHASSLAFAHPASGQRVSWQSPPSF